jgi:hypothetical protein
MSEFERDVVAEAAADIRNTGVRLHVYWCPVCKRQTTAPWHRTDERAPGLIPHATSEHDCIRIPVVPA